MDSVASPDGVGSSGAGRGVPRAPSGVTDPAGQIEFTDEFVAALRALEGGRSVFLTGKAGTGKSTLIRHFVKTTHRNLEVVAPTGVAALNVDGYTIHRLFSFGSSTTLDDVRGGRYRPGRFAKVLEGLDTLIIDEASMLRADMLDQVEAALRRFGPKRGQPFGGVQIVLVGDLFQLPPVVPDSEKGWLAARYETPYFFSSESFSSASIPTLELTKVFRQRGDAELTGLLNAVREGQLVEHLRLRLNERTDPEFEPAEDEFWLTVAPTNRVVNARNKAALARLSSPEVRHVATSSGDISMFDKPVEDDLRFKAGAQVMLLNNDTGGRWVNGSLGRVVEVLAPDSVLVQLNSGGIVTVEPHTWEVTSPVVSGGSLHREVVGSFTQLPFKLAWAVTIHKCQGQTLDRLVVDLTGGAFDYGQVYVALSRCTSMEGLVLKRDVLPKDLKTDRRVLRFLTKARGKSGPQKYCAVGVLPVGNEGRMDRPRPVEVAVAFGDGTGISTLINPQRDLAGARENYGIAVDDVLLAPTLAEAWPVFEILLQGSTPVAVAGDLGLDLVDVELKRLGVVRPLPVPVEVSPDGLPAGERAALRSGSALQRARAALAAHQTHRRDDEGIAFGAPDEDAGPTLLLSRDRGCQPPEMPASAAEFLQVSWEVGRAILDGRPPRRVGSEATRAAVRETLAARLTEASENSAGVPAQTLERLSSLELLLGPMGSVAAGARGPEAGEVLFPGARICLTGDAFDLDGRPLARWVLEEHCESLGLVPVKNVTKTRCDVLAVAELGTQSKKARTAKEYGKPVISVEALLRWNPTDFVTP